MKITIYPSKLIIMAALLVTSVFTQAQNMPPYKGVVVENPNAERDIKLVNDFLTALQTNKLTKARSFLSPSFMMYDSGDPLNTDQLMKILNRNFNSISNLELHTDLVQTFRVKSGKQTGDWVSLWGASSWTDKQLKKKVTYPQQTTFKIANGQIISYRVYQDESSIMRQLGYTFTPPKVAKK